MGRIGIKGHARRRDRRDPDPDRIDKAGKAVMAADPQAGGVFAAMADFWPAVIRASIACRAQDVDLIPAAWPMFMRPDLAGRWIHRQPLRVAVPDGEDVAYLLMGFGICVSGGFVSSALDRTAKRVQVRFNDLAEWSEGIAQRYLY